MSLSGRTPLYQNDTGVPPVILNSLEEKTRLCSHGRRVGRPDHETVLRAGGTPTPRPAKPTALSGLRAIVAGVAFSSIALSSHSASAAEGVSPAVEDLYVRGIKYLAASQTAEGTYPGSYGTESAVVGLSVIAMLARGDDPNHGPYRVQIAKGLEYILSKQDATTGYIGTSMYNHGFATLALAESYGAVENERLGPALQKAVELIVSSQKKNPEGGWRYGPDSTDADSTVSGAQMVALFAARNAGLPVPDEAFERGIAFLVSCQTADGGIGYTNANGPNNARTAIGLLILSLARKYTSQELRAAVEYLRNGDGGGNEQYYQYYLYYAAQAWFQAEPAQWAKWNEALVTELAESQQPEGSWDGQFGPAFGTSASLLALALNYRLLPIYER